MVMLRGRSTLDMSRCVFFANCIVRAVRSGDKVQIAWQASDIVRVSFCEASYARQLVKIRRVWNAILRGRGRV